MKKFRNSLPFVMALIILLLLLDRCNNLKSKAELLTQIANYKLSEQEFKVKVQKDSSTISSQNQTILSQKEAIKIGLLKLEGEIAKVQSQVTQTQKIKYESVKVKYIPKNYADTSGWRSKLLDGEKSVEFIDSLMANSIIVPQDFKLKDKWIEIDGKVNKEGLVIDTLIVPNESSVTIGYKNSGFLGLKKKPIVEIKNTNPYLQVTNMKNIIVKEKKSILNSKILWFGVGIFAGGYLLK